MAVIKVTVEINDDAFGGGRKNSGFLTVPADQVLRDGRVMPETQRMIGNLGMMVYDSLSVELARKHIKVAP